MALKLYVDPVLSVAMISESLVLRSPCGGIGRRGRLKICCPRGRGSSSLPGGTKFSSDFEKQEGREHFDY